MFQDKAQSAVNGHSLNKDCTNPPGADWDSRRLARRVDAMDGIHSAVLGHNGPPFGRVEQSLAAV